MSSARLPTQTFEVTSAPGFWSALFCRMGKFSFVLDMSRFALSMYTSIVTVTTAAAWAALAVCGPRRPGEPGRIGPTYDMPLPLVKYHRSLSALSGGVRASLVAPGPLGRWSQVPAPAAWEADLRGGLGVPVRGARGVRLAPIDDAVRLHEHCLDVLAL